MIRRLALILALAGSVSALPALADHPGRYTPYEVVKFEGTIVDAAVATPAFSTLVTALTAANLVGVLQGPGPFTVYAPTNDAFAKVPAPVLNLLLSDTNALTQVLTYHVSPGVKDLRWNFTPRDLKTVQGQEVYVERERDGIKINNSIAAKQIIRTSNGVIYVIDSVLLPQYR